MNKIFYGKAPKIYIPVYTAVFYVIFVLCDRTYFAAVTLVSALIHELGHIAAAKLCGVGIEAITLYPFGADIKLGAPLCSYGKDVIIASAGALCNLLTVFAAYFFRGNAVADAFAVSGVTLAVTNLLPVSELDGGQILKAALYGRFGDGTARTVLSAVSFVTVVLMWAVSVYVLLVLDGNPSLFVIAVSLFVSVFLRGR